MTSDANFENLKPKTAEQIVAENDDIAQIVMEDNAVARVMLLLNLSIMSADQIGVFEQRGPAPVEGKEDLMLQLAEDETVLAIFVRSDAADKLREAGYDV